MSRLIEFSCWMYEGLLLLYPEELREDFGAEMMLAFTDDLEQAWGDARLAGVMQIWWYALRELITIAIPSQLSNRYILVPVFAFLVAIFSESSFVCFGAIQIQHVDFARVVALQWRAVLFASVTNALVGFIVTCFYSRRWMNVLRLD